jgi:hypothetical protein
MASVPGLHGRPPRVTPTSCCVSSWVSAGCQLNDAMHPSSEHSRPSALHKVATDPSLCTVVASASAVEKVLVEALVASETSNLWWCTIPLAGSLVCHVLNIDRVETIELLDRYAVPSHIVETKHRISRRCWPPKQWMPSRHSSELEVVGPRGPSSRRFQELFTDLLHLDYVPARTVTSSIWEAAPCWPRS